MKTRTLLLLALACGLAIMVAGAVFLFQLATTDELADPIPLGEAAEVADMRVTVLDADEVDGSLVVTVRIGGVDDGDGASGFRLIASGRPVRPEPPSTLTDACEATTVEPRTCLVAFDTSVADTASRVLFYDRGDESVRWVLG
jgi:hypothetical protein